MPDWLRVGYGIEKPSNKLLALTDLDSNTWVSEVKRIRGKKQPLSSAGFQGCARSTPVPSSPRSAGLALSSEPKATPRPLRAIYKPWMSLLAQTARAS